MKRLELTDFQSCIGSSFDFTGEIGGASVHRSLTLTSAKAYELDPRDVRAVDKSGKYRTAPFSVFFEDESADYLLQGIYKAEHPSFEQGLEIFLVPLGPNSKQTGFLYEAAFG